MSESERADGDAAIPLCSQCGKPAVVKVGASPLCVDHYEALQRAELMAQQSINIKWNQAASFLNQINYQLDRSMPFGLPRPQMPMVPTPSLSTGRTTFISVSGGTIGAINTGTVEHLNVAIGALAQMGQTAFADTIRDLSQVIVDDSHLSKEAKDEVLEQIELLARQGSAPPQNRASGVLKGVFRAIPSVLAASKEALDVWDRLSPGLRTALGL